MELWLKTGTVTEKRGSEGIMNRKRKENKMPEDDKSVPAGAGMCDLSARKKKGGFRNLKLWCKGRPRPEAWIASRCTEFKGKYTWLVIGLTVNLDVLLVHLVKA
jgi:hypothetical protein